MDDVAVGRLIMLVRQRRNWRQVDLARAAGVSQQSVAVAEAGAMERLTVRCLRAIAASLEIRLPFAPRWHGGEIDRLQDREHAALVEELVRCLRQFGWEVTVEFTFSVFGERGAIDVLAWHSGRRALLIVEVKSRIFQVHALLAGIDRKARLAPGLVRQRGWVPLTEARVLVASETTANRSVVKRHAAIFESSLPASGRTVRAWVREPTGDLRGVWFLSLTSGSGGIQVPVGRRRVRARRSRSTLVGRPLAEPRITSRAGA